MAKHSDVLAKRTGKANQKRRRALERRIEVKKDAGLRKKLLARLSAFKEDSLAVAVLSNK
jgi:hypothetical protein